MPLSELMRGDGRLDTWVRTLTLAALLCLSVALVGTTLLLRNPSRSNAAHLVAGEEIALMEGEIP